MFLFMNTRLNGCPVEIQNTTIGVKTANFIRQYDMLLLQHRIAENKPCYLILTTKNWSHVLCYCLTRDFCNTFFLSIM